MFIEINIKNGPATLLVVSYDSGSSPFNDTSFTASFCTINTSVNLHSISCIFHNKTYTKLNSVIFLVRFYYFCVGRYLTLPYSLCSQGENV